MNCVRVLLMAAWPLFATAGPAAPPVTSPTAPSPEPALASAWFVASLQAPVFEILGDKAQRSEALRMLVAVKRDERLAPGVGWYDPSQRRHDWAWLAQRYDADHDGRITAKEFTAPPEYFERLDRNGDGAITADDLDWSEQSRWVQDDDRALRLFRAIDRDGNGRITEEEMQAYFKKLAGEKGHITPRDLRQTFGVEKTKGKRVSKEMWLKCLMAGDLGSPFEGPHAGQSAPDFTLTTHDGKKQVTLSGYRGNKPVVLIFGSFT